MLVTSALITGLGLGSMYGLLALGFHVTYAVSATVNFAQGSSMMLGAVLTYTFAVRLGWPLPLAAALALALCALYGMLVEILAVRPFAKRGSNAWLMATVALGIVADNTVLFTFGKEPRGFQMPWATGSFEVAGITLSPLHVVIPVAGLLLAAALNIFSTRTRAGKAMLAVVQNPDAARLMGINVQATILGAYALSTVFAGAAGVLIAPLFNVNADMGTLFGLKAFAVAILGGISSAWGVMLAGILFGCIEALITALLGSTYTQILTFGLVIVALAAMPTGLFGRAAVKKV
ncbi:MAG TPA: branched-chain amino acid ABC transporter permease [Burkholderiales bacterium]|jgi:branched-chain amino acid transport system permease protein|nr:branched-chain amino acid ABC transporter permease [Burkholderiales bacterium]